MMKSCTEIKLCCITNDINVSRKQQPVTPAEMTKFYNELVQSDFTNVTKSPVTFSKEPRFKTPNEDSPGPGYYNPQRKRLSNYSISKTYADIKSNVDRFHSP